MPIQEEAAQALVQLRAEAGESRCALGITRSFPDIDFVAAVSASAYDAGLRAGDRIVTIDGEEIEPRDQRRTIRAVLLTKKPGDLVKLRIARAERELTLTIPCLDGSARDRAILAVVEATDEARWDDCIGASYQVERHIGPSALAANMRLTCNAGAMTASGRPATITDRALLYDYIKRLLNEASYGRDGLTPIARDVEVAIAALRNAGSSAEADDLERQWIELDGSPAPPGNVAVALGTCFVVHPNGIILTASHLVDDARVIRVRLADGRSLQATITAQSDEADIAAIQVAAATPNYVTLAQPDRLRVGDPVFTLGFPIESILGAEPRFTDGTISALSGPKGQSALIQVSVPVQPGNSGGPLANDAGEVVGVMAATTDGASFKAASGALPQNINWAASIDYARALFAAPPPPPATSSRRAAIERMRSALCRIESSFASRPDRNPVAP